MTKIMQSLPGIRGPILISLARFRRGNRNVRCAANRTRKSRTGPGPRGRNRCGRAALIGCDCREVETVLDGGGFEEVQFCADVDKGVDQDVDDFLFNCGVELGIGGWDVCWETDFCEEHAYEADVGLRVEPVLGEPLREGFFGEGAAAGGGEEGVRCCSFEGLGGGGEEPAG